MRLFARSLLGRIVSSFFLLSALLVLLVAAAAYVAIVGDARRSVVSQLDTLATAKERALQSWVRESTRRVEFAATIDAVASAAAAHQARARELPADPARAAALRGVLESVRLRWPELGELLYATDPGGLVIASTTPALEGEYRLHDAWYVRGQAGTCVQNVYPSPVTLQPTLTISAPVTAPSGELLGVLAANLDLSVLDEVVRELSGPFPTAESHLVDRFCAFVSAHHYGSESFPRGAHSPGIDAAIRGTDGSGVYTDHRGIPVIGVYRWLDAHELALLVEVPTVDAFRAARRQTAAIAGMGLGVVAVLAAGVFLLARRIARPILAVEETARRVAAGDMEARAPVQTTDEIGALARSFNEMAGRLGDLYAAMQRNEERFRTLTEASADSVAVLDREGKFTFVSPQTERDIGVSAGRLIGTDALTIVHPDDAERVRDLIRLIVDTAQTGDTLSIEYRVRGADGRWYTVESAVRNLLGHPAIGGILVNTRDITERRHLEEELAQAQRMEAVGRLAGGIAHDFNNLLTAIIGYAELLAEEPGLGPEAADEVAEIGRAAERAAALTQQLLAFSRKQVLQPRVLNLNALVVETEGMLRRIIGENIAIRSHLDPALCPVEADPGQIARVIVNLSANSRDAMPEGGTLTISTRTVTLKPGDIEGEGEIRPGPHALLEVTDTGVGMDEGTLRRLYEPFFTTKGVGKGTGLGLATVYGIVRQSGGLIAAESRLGGGTTFRVYLPAALRATSSEPPVERAEAAAGSELVLLVEDEEAVRKLMHDALARAGYRVISSRSPDDALAAATREGGADLLVTDVVMPGMDGGKLAEILRRRYPGMRALFISGYTEDDRLLRGAMTDELSFLQKPFTPAVLASRVRAILDRAAGHPVAPFEGGRPSTPAG